MSALLHSTYAAAVLLAGIAASASIGAAETTSSVDSSVRPIRACAPDFVSTRVASDVWLADSCGGLFRSSDGGKLWQPIPKTQMPASQFTAGRLAAMLWLSESNGVIVSNSGEVVLTKDGGRTWRKRSLPIGGPILAGARVDAHFWFCNANSELVRSDDAGKSWSTLPSLPFHRGCGALTFGDENSGWAAPSAGERATWGSVRRGGWKDRFAAAPELWRTSDGGRHWTKAPPLNPQLHSMTVFLETPMLGWLFGDSTILVTGDGGDHWAPTSFPHPIEPTLRVRRSTHWSSQLDAAEAVEARKMLPWPPPWQSPVDAPRMQIPNRAIVPTEAATIIDDEHALVVQRQLLRVFVDNARVDTFPLLEREGDSHPEELVAAVNNNELHRWAWSKMHLYRSEDAFSRWYVVLDAPEPMERIVHPRFDRLLARTASGHVHRLQGDPLVWGPADDPDDVIDWDAATEPPGHDATAFGCVGTATSADLVVRITETGCFHSRHARVHFNWSGAVSTVDADLTEFRGQRTTGTLPATEAQALAKALAAMALGTNVSRLGGTTHRGVSLYWRCGTAASDATHFDDRPSGNATEQATRVELLLDAIRNLLSRATAAPVH